MLRRSKKSLQTKGENGKEIALRAVANLLEDAKAHNAAARAQATVIEKLTEERGELLASMREARAERDAALADAEQTAETSAALYATVEGLQREREQLRRECATAWTIVSLLSRTLQTAGLGVAEEAIAQARAVAESSPHR